MPNDLPLRPSPPACVQAEQHKAARAAAEVQGATFHPEISALARTLWDGEGPKAWQRLVNCNRWGWLGAGVCAACGMPCPAPGGWR